MTGVWLRSPSFDGVFFLGSGVIALAVGLVVIIAPQLLIPLLWIWMLLVEGPHLFATLQRTVLDPSFRKEKSHTFWLTLAIGSVPLWIWAIAELVFPPAVGLILGLGALWSVHHGIRQHHGIVSLYNAKSGATPEQRRLDWYALHGTLWCVVIAAQLLLPVNRSILGLPSWAWDAASFGGLVAAGLSAVGLALMVRRILSGLRGEGSAVGGLVALGPIAVVFILQAFLVGLAEPVYAAAPTPEQQLLAVTLVGGLLHGLQYLGIAAIANPPRLSRRSGWVGFLGGHAGWAYLVAVLLSLGYLVLNAGRSAHPGWSLFDPASVPARFFVAVYWAVFFHHYALDARIWRVGRDIQLREELGL